MEGAVEDVVDRRLSEEGETRTVDGGVSVLNVQDKVVHVFHEPKGSEGDDVFEEAVADPEDLPMEGHWRGSDFEGDVVNGGENGVSTGQFDPLLTDQGGDEAHEIAAFREVGKNNVSGKHDGEGRVFAEEEVKGEGLVAGEDDSKVDGMEDVADGDDNADDSVAAQANGTVVGHGESDTNENFHESVDRCVDGEIQTEGTSENSVDMEGKLQSGDSDEVESKELTSESSVDSSSEEKPASGDSDEGKPKEFTSESSVDCSMEEKAESGDTDEVKPKEFTSESSVDSSSMEEKAEIGDTDEVESKELTCESSFDSMEEKPESGDLDVVKSKELTNESSFDSMEEKPEIGDLDVVKSKELTNESSFDSMEEKPEIGDLDVVKSKELTNESSFGSMEEKPESGDLDVVNSKELTNESSVDSMEEKPENGDMDEVKSKVLPSVCSKTVNAGEVYSHETNLSQGIESNGQTQHLENQSNEKKYVMTDAGDTVVGEVKVPEERNGISNPGASVDEEAKASESPNPSTELSSPKSCESSKADVAGEAGNIGQKSDALHINENVKEKPADHINSQVSEGQEAQNRLGTHGSAPVETSAGPGSTRDTVTPASVNTAQPPLRKPAGLGGAASLLEPAPRAVQQPRANVGSAQPRTHVVEDATNNGETQENDEMREKLQMIRVKFLRLARRLGQTPHNVVVAQVLYRLGLAEQLRGSNSRNSFSFDRANFMAEQLEAVGQEPLDFSCTIMVLGKTGVGKSATINSIFDEMKFGTDAFQMGTKKVQDVVGTVEGIKVRVIDTPGLLPSWSDQRYNEKVLHSVKRFIKKTPPDIVLYLDRLDMQSRDSGDMQLLRTITEIFGPSIWFNAIVVLTHAASAPPEGPNGTASSYEMFVTQRSHVVQQAIRQAAGDMRLMNPVSLVENHSACRTNRAGQRVLPNGQVWKPHLLLLSFASKVLVEANTLLKLQDSPAGKPFATRPRVPPLPLLLSALLQSRPPVKLPDEQYGDEDDFDVYSDDSSGSEDEVDYDELPPFKRLTRAQLAKLSKTQRKEYFDELEYREKLFMKRQLKEEKKRLKLMKKMGASAATDVPSDYNENAEEDSGPASVPIAMPDFVLPNSFDSDNPAHRYRFLDTSNQWLVRPVLETHGWDHDVGYEGVNVERMFAVKEKIPVSFSGQATKDKKEFNVQMDLASSIKYGEGKFSSLAFDMQNLGKDMAYTLRSETKFFNHRHNKTAAGISFTLLGDALSAGIKLENKLVANKRFRLLLSGGGMYGRGDMAYGGSLEATFRDKDYPLGRMLTTFGVSVMDWHGDLAVGYNVQTQLPIGRHLNLVGRANVNNRGSGQASIRFNSTEQLQIALIALLPVAKKALAYYQQIMNGEENTESY
ncbi:hypothetical protein Sjap_009978 [Stephania japonica]|uniref:AIG1-type G domain-containing protein n=1 Tax=Stephania japonica TaxID=461633 RepID=A0AAP0P6Q3_9MAGN